jgi:hypothetical protein
MMKNVYRVFVSVLLGGGWLVPATPAAGQNLLFHSGFGEAVYLDSEFIDDDDGYVCEQLILGEDLETGFSWPIKVLGGTGYLQYIGHDFHQALENEIQTVIGPGGTPTRALYSVQHYGSPVGNIGQCPYTIDEITDGTSDLFIRYWIKINADYVNNVNGRGAWRTFFEWKSEDYAAGDGFRLIAFIYLDEGSDTPYWHWQGDADPGSPVWEIDNREVPVPIGEWFLTEFFWHWNEGEDGRALWKVNHQVIGDHLGPTTRNSKPIDFIMLTQIYGSTDDDVVTAKHQWVDDIEIWDGLPETTSEIFSDGFESGDVGSWQDRDVPRGVEVADTVVALE